MSESIFSFVPLLVMFFLYLIPVALIIFTVVKFYKLLKEKNELLKEISKKLDKIE